MYYVKLFASYSVFRICPAIINYVQTTAVFLEVHRRYECWKEPLGTYLQNLWRYIKALDTDRHLQGGSIRRSTSFQLLLLQFRFATFLLLELLPHQLLLQLSARRRRRRFEGWCTVKKRKQNCLVKFFHSAFLCASDKCVLYIYQLSSTGIILLVRCFSVADAFLQVYDISIFPYTEWRKNHLTFLCIHVNSSVKRRWRHLHTYFSTIRTETTCSDGQGYRFGV